MRIVFAILVACLGIVSASAQQGRSRAWTASPVLVNKSWHLRHADMATRSGWTPFDGMEVTGWPIATVIRGQIVMRDDQVLLEGAGRPVRFQETLNV